MARSIVITDYDPRWPMLYQEEKASIMAIIGRQLVAIEHIGSTAVPGLDTKPIIDIMAAVPRLSDAEECIEQLAVIGYRYLPPQEVGIPERRYFRKGTQEVHTHHLHMVALTSQFWERHRLFRDFLRAHSETAQQYCRLKKELAARYGSDVDGYTEAKTPFIESIMARARTERESQSNSVPGS